MEKETEIRLYCLSLTAGMLQKRKKKDGLVKSLCKHAKWYVVITHTWYLVVEESLYLRCFCKMYLACSGLLMENKHGILGPLRNVI